tara:strand:+ start:121 stop:303 length:183 start_codon:yes stop_codon:yes gene_type:complete
MEIKCNVCIEAKTQKLPHIEEVNDGEEIFCNNCDKFLAEADKDTYTHKWAIDKKYVLLIN